MKGCENMVDWSRVAGITITGLVVVFIALILLIFIIWLMGTISAVVGKKKKDALSMQAPSPQASEPPALINDPEQTLDHQTVAVIAAAISAAWDGDQPFAIKSIQRDCAQRPIWRQTGIMENTRPF